MACPPAPWQLRRSCNRRVSSHARPAEWRAPPATRHHPSRLTSSVSIHCRARLLATSGLFWSSACITSIGRPSSEPPKSATANSVPTLFPGPPLSLYVPPTSLSRPMRIAADTLWARIRAGRARGAAANPAIRSAARDRRHACGPAVMIRMRSAMSGSASSRAVVAISRSAVSGASGVAAKVAQPAVLAANSASVIGFFGWPLG